MGGPVVMFPKVLKPSAQQSTPHGQQRRGAFATQKMAGLLGPPPNDGLAASLHYARADEIAGLSKRVIEHLGAVAFKVGDLLLDQFTGLSFSWQVGFGLSEDLSDLVLEQGLAPLAIASLGQSRALPVKSNAQQVQMLTGMVVIQDTNRIGEVQAGQFPHPNCSIAQENHHFGLGHAPPNTFGA